MDRRRLTDRPLRVGLTGGIGSGKSMVARLFHDLGVPVIDTDEVARQLVRPGQPALAQIAQLFGTAILTPDGELDRAAMRDLVFSAPEKRRQLEDILHPLIRRKVAEWAAGQDAAYCVIVIPLLIEAGWLEDVDRVLVVDSPVTQQLERTATRDSASKSNVRAIIDAQCSREARIAAADDVITNDGAPDKLKPQVERLHQIYLARVRE